MVVRRIASNSGSDRVKSIEGCIAVFAIGSVGNCASRCAFFRRAFIRSRFLLRVMGWPCCSRYSVTCISWRHLRYVVSAIFPDILGRMG